MQTKTQKKLRQELSETYVSWWMDAATKTIASAQLQDVFFAHLTDIARRNGHEDVIGELLKSSSMPVHKHD